VTERQEIEVKLIPRPEEIPVLCGITRADMRQVDYIHDLVDTLHSFCEVRTGMAEQVKPAVSFNIEDACRLRDLMIENANRLLKELLERVLKECPP